MEQYSESYIGYAAFVLGYDLLHNSLTNSLMADDEAYDYCVQLAREFAGSKYDDECEPAYDCIENFATDKMTKILEDIGDFNISVGGKREGRDAE